MFLQKKQCMHTFTKVPRRPHLKRRRYIGGGAPPVQWKGREKRTHPSHLGPQEIEYQDLRFPANLSNPFAVATVLNQEPGKLKIKELKQGNCHLVYHKPVPGAE